MPEFNSCPAHDESAEPKEPLAGLSRRNFFTSLAVAAGSIGLTSLASSAEAASKKYKVCATKDIRVGSAISVWIAGAKTFALVTQPKTGTFRAFDQRCTHAGQTKFTVKAKMLECQAHGARFDPDSGAAMSGPTSKPLKKFAVSVEKKFVYVTIKS